MTDAMREWMAHRPPPSADQFRPGDRVRFRRHYGIVLRAWRGGDGFTSVGETWLRIELDNGKRLECRAGLVVRG